MARYWILGFALIACEANLQANEPPPAPAAPAEAQPSAVALLGALKERRFEEPVLAELETLLQPTEAPAPLNDDQKAQWTAKRREVLTLLELAQQQLTRAAEFERDSQPDEVQRRLADLRAALNAPPPPPVPLDDVSLSELEQRVVAKQAEVAKHQERFANAQNEIGRRSARRSEIPKLIAAATIRLDELDPELDAANATDLPEEWRTLHRAALLAEKLAKKSEIEWLQRELQKYDATAELMPLRHDRAARDLSVEQKELKRLQDLLAERRRSEAERSAREARLALLQAAGADPRVREIAEQNADLAERRKILAERQQQRAKEFDRERRRYEPMLKSFDNLRERAELADSEGRAALLHLQVRMLPDVSEFRAKSKEVARDLGASELAKLEYQSEWSRLADLNREIEELLATDGERPELLDQALREHLGTKRANLDALNQATEQYIQQLRSLQAFWEESAASAKDIREYIAERILWARSTAPLGLSSLTSAAGWSAALATLESAGQWMFSPRSWSASAMLLGADVRQYPLLWLAAMLVCGSLMLIRPRLRRLVREQGEIAARKHVDVFRPTALTACYTLVLTVVWLALPAFVGWRWYVLGALGSHAHALGAGLLATLVVCLPLELLRQTCRPGGLAVAHFDWPSRAISLLRGSIRQWIALTVPLVLVSTILHCHASLMPRPSRGWSPQAIAAAHLDWNDSVGRVAFICFMLVLAGFVHKLLHPGSGVFEETLAVHRGGWLDRLRWVWFPVSIGAPLSLAGLAAAGYYYTATQLAWRLAATLDLVLGLLLTHAMLLRLLLVVRRRLAMEQARQRRAALLESRESGDNAEPVLESDRLDLAVVNQQTRHLLQSAVICAAMLGMCAVWVDVLPALKQLNEYHVWSESPITVGNLLTAGLFAMMTFLAARNIPGLLEITILQKLPLQAGSGYAITTICRYCTVVIGMFATSQQLNIGWDKVQWLVAAVSVGLGFGLQEIFGNFISGLIILFERPVRVGDVITVGQVTGAVSKIRMRATTILDPDRKELIVPNKEFITGQVVNWTLSDDILRIGLRLQVEYPCDTALVQKLMLKAAQEHPNVLSEPAPSAYFEEVRESSLQFVLWVFLPSLSVISRTRHELLTTITSSFQAAGIELAFPLRELHRRREESTGSNKIRKSA